MSIESPPKKIKKLLVYDPKSTDIDSQQERVVIAYYTLREKIPGFR
tara:strand:+ start:367 stop:504 length:138 start_codon:yes stop_codon:yes gene_type:complete